MRNNLKALFGGFLIILGMVGLILGMECFYLALPEYYYRWEATPTLSVQVIPTLIFVTIVFCSVYTSISGYRNLRQLDHKKQLGYLSAICFAAAAGLLLYSAGYFYE